MTKCFFVGAATPPPIPGLDLATVAVALPLDAQGTLSLTHPAGGVAGPTKNENLEYFHASRVPTMGKEFNIKKVLLYPCGGVGLVVSTVTRLACLKAAEEMMPGQLELLDMHRCQRGAPDEIALLENCPVIVLDGCRQQCGSYFLNMLGVRPAARLYTPAYIARFKLKPGKNRTELETEGQQLSEVMAQEAVAIAQGILKGPYPFKKQKVRQKNLPCCDYSLDMGEALAYDEINPRVHRPEAMPPLPGLEDAGR